MFSVSAKDLKIFRFYFKKQFLRKKNTHQHLLDRYLWTVNVRKIFPLGLSAHLIQSWRPRTRKLNTIYLMCFLHVCPSQILPDFSDLETKFVLNSVNVSPLDEITGEVNYSFFADPRRIQHWEPPVSSPVFNLDWKMWRKKIQYCQTNKGFVFELFSCVWY